MAVAAVELERVRREVSELETRRDGLLTEAKSAMESGDFDTAIRLGGQAALIEADIVKASQKLARMDSEASANVLADTASEFKAFVEKLVAANAEQINEYVRQIWGLQPGNKLSSIILGVDYDHPMSVPSVSLRGGLTTGRTRKESAPRTKWVDSTDGAVLSTKSIWARYGAKYGQTVAFSDASPAERAAFRDRIIAGEGGVIRVYTEEDEADDED